ncbi:MAG: dihydrolipoamide acetyltransferase family protein [Eubacteriales bacterium]
MAEKVIMPKQGLQMTEGTIIKWLKQEGEACIEGEPLFEMETDKLTITMDAPASGTLIKIVRQEGETVPITELIAVIGQTGEDIAAMLGIQNGPQQKADSASTSALTTSTVAETHSTDKGSGFSTPRARMRAQEKSIDIAGVRGTGPDSLVIERDVLAYDAKGIKATPLAKITAQIQNIDLQQVAGSGPHGKIMRDDISAFQARKTKAENRGERVIPISAMRKVIAQRMTESLRIHAQLTHVVRVDMTNATELREIYKKEEKKISYNDIVLMAASRALKDFPMMNACITDKGILMRDYVNLGLAVAVDNGLIVPNIKDADLMRLEEISGQARELAQKAKDNRLTEEDYTGGTFTVSNLGMFGLDEFTAIINSPESGILAVGAVQKTPVVVDDAILIRPVMSITLTYDHRIVDGAPAAAFLGRVKKYIETPSLML